jgi:F-type H+-transporting ATPase subunit b
MIDIDIMGKLFPDLKTMLVQLAATGVLFYAFKRYLWKPVSEYLEKRAQHSQQQIEDARLLKDEAEQSKAHAIAELRHASAEAVKIIERGVTEGKRIKDTLVSDARREAQQKLDSARRQMEAERLAMESDIHREIVDVALLAAGKLMEDRMDETSDRLAVEKFIKDAVN